MRISDWSSDVCSSDLHHLEVVAVQHGEHVVVLPAGMNETVVVLRDQQPDIQLRLQRPRVYDDRYVFVAGTRTGHGLAAPQTLNARAVLAENGRASCMDSGCQYSKVTVVAECEKKNTK